MHTMNRRALVAGAAALPAVAVPALAGVIISPCSSLEADWQERLDLIEQQAISSACYWQVHDHQLAEWAAIGPEYLDHEGKGSVAKSGWPQVKDFTLPAAGEPPVKVRWAPHDAELS